MKDNLDAMKNFHIGFNFFASLFMAFGSLLSIFPASGAQPGEAASTEKLNIASHFKAAGNYIAKATDDIEQDSR